jgi:hypothetical protein
VEEDEPDEVVPEGCSPEHERRRRGVVRAKEGAKELGREGKRGGEGRGLFQPFIGAEGASGRGGWGGKGSVNGFNAIEDGARLRGVKDGP